MVLENKLPRISIITPSYNQGCYLEETIRSVLDQNYPDLEYIIIDGGSTDQSVEIIKKYANRLAYWVSEKDRGQTHAINKGFERCTGCIVAWINSDDIYLPGTLARVADHVIRHPSTMFLYGDAEIIDSQGHFLMYRKELPADKTMGNLLSWGLLIPQPSAFWRRQTFEKVGFLNENLQYIMDSEFWFRVSQEFELQHISHIFSKQRYHAHSKTNSAPIDPRYKEEMESLLRSSYQELSVSKIIPYRYAWLIRKIYRSKRIVLRMISGHYFSGYIPDWIMKKRKF